MANDLLFFGGFSATAATEAQSNREKAAQAVPGLVEAFLAGQHQIEKIAPYLRPVYHAVAAGCTATMPVFAMKYAASDACIGCGLCAKSCPKSNIQMVEKRPEFGKNCIFCTRSSIARRTLFCMAAANRQIFATANFHAKSTHQKQPPPKSGCCCKNVNYSFR